MDRQSKTRDRKEKKLNTREKPVSDKWRQRSLYGMNTDKTCTEGTSKAAQKRMSSSRDYLPYRDARFLLLEQHQQQASQVDSSVTPERSDSLRSLHPRPGSYVKRELNAGNSNTSELSVRKGSGEETDQQRWDRITSEVWNDPNHPVTRATAYLESLTLIQRGHLLTQKNGYPNPEGQRIAEEYTRILNEPYNKGETSKQQ